jgi:hypothetical protein
MIARRSTRVKPHVVPAVSSLPLSVCRFSFRGWAGGGKGVLYFFFVRLAHLRLVRVLQRTLVLQADVVRLESI